MAACPSCRADVDEEADLCLSCGEPLGDSPAARLARKDASAPPPPAAPSGPGAPVRAKGPAPASRATVAEGPSARRKRIEEAEPVRCPGCGSPSRAARCPGCGAVLRRED